MATREPGRTSSAVFDHFKAVKNDGSAVTRECQLASGSLNSAGESMICGRQYAVSIDEPRAQALERHVTSKHAVEAEVLQKEREKEKERKRKLSVGSSASATSSTSNPSASKQRSITAFVKSNHIVINKSKEDVWKDINRAATKLATPFQVIIFLYLYTLKICKLHVPL